MNMAFSCIVYGEEDDADDDRVEDAELETHPDEAQEHGGIQADVGEIKVFWYFERWYYPTQKSHGHGGCWVHSEATSRGIEVLEGLFTTVPFKDADADDDDAGTEANLSEQATVRGDQIAVLVFRHSGAGQLEAGEEGKRWNGPKIVVNSRVRY